MYRIHTFACLLLSIISNSPALSQTSPSENGEACYRSYQVASQFASSFEISGNLAGNYVMRMYQSGQSLSAERRHNIEASAFEESLQLSEDFGASLFEETDSMRQLSADVSQCDQEFNITRASIEEPYVEHLECATRYGTLAYSYTGPQQKAYFNNRAQHAVRLDAFSLGLNVDPNAKGVQESAKKAAISAQEIFSGGDPDMQQLWSAFNASHACDRQYGFQSTPIPQNILDTISGKVE